MAKHEEYIGFEHLYDARIRTEDGFEFPIHRVLLAMRSEYFRSLLCKLPVEDKDIFVSGIEGSTMEIILEYIYTGNLNLTRHNIKDVLIAAYYLGIDELLKSARIFAIRNLSITNSIPLLIAAIRYDELNILTACSRYIEVNFEGIVKDRNSKFEELPVEYLERFLAQDCLNVSSERQIWNAIDIWVGKSAEKRRLYLKRLIQCIRFQESSDDLASEILDHPLVADHPLYIDLAEMLSGRCSTLKRCIPKMVFLVIKCYLNRFDYSEGIKVFITYDGEIDLWRNVSSKVISPDVVLHGSGSLIMMFETRMNLVHAFDIVSKRWSTLNPPSASRRLYNVVKMRNHIYVVGGLWYQNETGPEVERYNIESGIWEVVRSPIAIKQNSAVAIGNSIYLIGTVSGYHNQYFVAQVYNPDTDAWRTISAPQTYRSQFALTAYRNQLLIIGGHDSEEILKSVEVYDIDADIWIYFEELPYSYVLPKAVTIRDILYVYDTSLDDLYDFDCPSVFWDENSKKWQVVKTASPFQDLHLYQFCTIEDSEVIMQLTQGNKDTCSSWEKSPFFTYLHS